VSPGQPINGISKTIDISTLSFDGSILEKPSPPTSVYADGLDFVETLGKTDDNLAPAWNKLKTRAGK